MTNITSKTAAIRMLNDTAITVKYKLRYQYDGLQGCAGRKAQGDMLRSQAGTCRSN
jgi:hypothetical protein